MISEKKWYLKYPNIPIEIVKFFSLESQNGVSVDKTILLFLNDYKVKYCTDSLPSPRIVSKICDLLVSHGKLSLVRKAGVEDMLSCYISVLATSLTDISESNLSFSLNCLVYGFPYLFNNLIDYIVPILHITQQGDETIGTGFYFDGGIVTAKHCIENAREIAIRGVNQELLKNCQIKIHKNPMMDIAFIKFNKFKKSPIRLYDDADILDEVMAVGYPIIPGFHNFLTAEKANVSSRLTVSKGQISGYGKDIWIKEELILITAKIKGGNSGGPIIRNDGSLIGIASQKPHSEGNYDDLGYGTVIPVKYIVETIDGGNILNISSIKFREFD